MVSLHGYRILDVEHADKAGARWRWVIPRAVTVVATDPSIYLA